MDLSLTRRSPDWVEPRQEVDEKPLERVTNIHLFVATIRLTNVQGDHSSSMLSSWLRLLHSTPLLCWQETTPWYFYQPTLKPNSDFQAKLRFSGFRIFSSQKYASIFHPNCKPLATPLPSICILSLAYLGAPTTLLSSFARLPLILIELHIQNATNIVHLYTYRLNRFFESLWIARKGVW